MWSSSKARHRPSRRPTRRWPRTWPRVTAPSTPRPTSQARINGTRAASTSSGRAWSWPGRASRRIRHASSSRRSRRQPPAGGRMFTTASTGLRANWVESVCQAAQLALHSSAECRAPLHYEASQGSRTAIMPTRSARPANRFCKRVSWLPDAPDPLRSSGLGRCHQPVPDVRCVHVSYEATVQRRCAHESWEVGDGRRLILGSAASSDRVAGLCPVLVHRRLFQPALMRAEGHERPAPTH